MFLDRQPGTVRYEGRPPSGLRRRANRAIVQITGEGFAMGATDAKAACTASRSLSSKIYQYDQLLLAQAQQSAACNARHKVEERLCRWLLRTRDVRGDKLELTHEFMAQMLGVRRTSVTLVARHLQAAGLIKYRRGKIQIIDSPPVWKRRVASALKPLNDKRCSRMREVRQRKGSHGIIRIAKINLGS
jgi:CRP-like cAMP-binding protein